MNKYYDIHCHVFNKDVIIRKLIKVVETLLEIADSTDIGSSDYKIQCLIDNLDVTTQDSSEDVFNVLDNAYEGKFIVTPLMLDLTFADDNEGNVHQNKRYQRRIKRVFKLINLLLRVIKGKMKSAKAKDLVDQLRAEIKLFNDKFKIRAEGNVEIFDDSNYKQQIIDLEFLAEKYDNVKPFFSIDPRQNYQNGINTIDTLTDKLLGVDAKFSGVKLYAPLGFSPTDPVLMGDNNQQGVYSFCAKHNIPITIHNSNSGFACFSTNIKMEGHLNINGAAISWPTGQYKFDNKFFSLKVGDAIKERASILNHPRIWELVLQKHPSLTINFAHFGGSGPLMDYVHYRIHENKIDVDDFEELVNQIPNDMQETIRSVYTKKRGHMILHERLSLSKQKKVWNAMYYAGLIDNWAKAIFDIVRNPNYPNAYTDLSSFSDGDMIDLPNDETKDKVFSIKDSLNNFKISFYDKLTESEKSKILYGSDYFLLQFFGIEMKQYLSDFKDVFGDEFIQIVNINPERFLSITK